MNKLKRYAIGIATRPLSRKVQLYTTPEYEQLQKDKKNPASPRYKKTITDKVFDRFVGGSKLLTNLGPFIKNVKN